MIQILEKLTSGSETQFKMRITLLLLAYCVIHLLLRLMLSPTLGYDDAEQALWAQDLRWIYSYSQPSLYTWLLYGMFQIFGKSVLPTALTRYALMFATLLLLFLTAQQVLKDRHKTVLAMCGWLMIYSLAVYAHHDLTNTTLLTLALTLTLYLFLRLSSDQNTWTYLLLGLALAIGILAKYNFLLFAVPLFAAAVFVPDYRKLVLDVRLPITLVLALALTSPHFVHLSRLPVPVDELGDQVFGISGSFNLLTIGKGIADLGLALLEFPQPFLVLALIFFPEAFRRPLDPQIRRLLILTALIGICAMLAAVIVVGATNFKGRWMHPILLTLPIWLFAGRLSSQRLEQRLNVYLWTTAAFSLVAIIGQIGVEFVEPRIGKKLRHVLPVSAVASRIAELGFADGLVVAENNHLAGNLVVHLPGARIFSARNQALAPFPPTTMPRLYIWIGDGGHRVDRVARHFSQSADRTPVIVGGGTMNIPLPNYPSRSVRFNYFVVH